MNADDEKERAKEGEEENTSNAPAFAAGPRAGMSLLDQRTLVMNDPNYREKTEKEKIEEQEAELVAAVSERKPMMAAKELADGTQYTVALKTNWRPPARSGSGVGCRV